MIRRARPGDREAIAAIEALVAPGAWTADAVADTLEQAATRAWVFERVEAESSPRWLPVGHLLTSRAADEAEVLTLAVAPSHRRQGIAAALMTRAAGYWRTGGVTAAFLEVRADNTAALALYDALGWERVGARPRYYRDGADAALMRWTPAARPARIRSPA